MLGFGIGYRIIQKHRTWANNRVLNNSTFVIYAYHGAPQCLLLGLLLPVGLTYGEGGAIIVYLYDNTDRNDTLVFVIADHSQINAKWFVLSDYPDLQALLKHPHSIEGRCASFMVKDGKIEEFRVLFKKHFGDHFLLMDHDEFLNSGLLGSGIPHPRTEGFVGDIIAIATDEYTIGETQDDTDMVGIHAGITKEEMEVPLIAF